MYILGIVLIIVGILYVLMLVLRPPFLYNNIKVKTMIKMMGKRGFDIFFLVWTILVLGGGIVLVILYK